jgi:hypothetical protein
MTLSSVVHLASPSFQRDPKIQDCQLVSGLADGEANPSLDSTSLRFALYRQSPHTLSLCTHRLQMDTVLQCNYPERFQIMVATYLLVAIRSSATQQEIHLH